MKIYLSKIFACQTDILVDQFMPVILRIVSCHFWKLDLLSENLELSSQKDNFWFLNSSMDSFNF